MNRRHVIGLAALLVLSSAGCTPSASYVAQRTGQGVVIGIPRCTSAPLEALTLRGVDGESAPRWSIRRASDGDPGQEVFVIGEVPAGFEEVVALEPDRLGEDDRLWPDVSPSFGSLGIVRLGDVPADGQAYRVDVDGRPELVGGLDVLEDDSLCGSGDDVVTRAAVVAALVVLSAFAVLVVMRVRSRRAEKDDDHRGG